MRRHPRLSNFFLSLLRLSQIEIRKFFFFAEDGFWMRMKQTEWHQSELSNHLSCGGGWGAMPSFLFFNTQTMPIKSIVHTQQHCYDFRKKLKPWRVSNPGLLFLLRMRCRLSHAASALSKNLSPCFSKLSFFDKTRSSKAAVPVKKSRTMYSHSLIKVVIFLFSWRRVVVVSASTFGTEDLGFESPLRCEVLGIIILRCCCFWLNSHSYCDFDEKTWQLFKYTFLLCQSWTKMCTIPHQGKCTTMYVQALRYCNSKCSFLRKRFNTLHSWRLQQGVLHLITSMLGLI
jgi:hypothetical protein